MKKNELFAVVLMFLATIGTVIGIFAYEKSRTKGYYTIELVARSPLNGNWISRGKDGIWHPRKVYAPFGKEVRLYIRNIETVSHGFALPDFNIAPAINEIKAGEVKEVKFLADRKGTFPFFCTVWCSNEHLQMSGEIIVE